MRKHLCLTLLLASLCLLLVGCGQKDETVPEENTSIESGEPAQTPPAETPAETDDSQEPDEASQGQQTDESPRYEDNFAVDEEAVTDFAKKIQAVVADKDLEGLADLMAFPNYVGFPEEGAFVDTREDFLALGAEQVFTDELLSEIAEADLEDLSPSMAGFILSKNGAPNIVFGVSDGHLAIVGINY